MAEMEAAIKRAEDRRIKRLNGRTTDENGVLAHTDKWVQNLPNLAAYTNFRQPMQSETSGLPFYIEGVHMLGAADNAGMRPSGG